MAGVVGFALLTSLGAYIRVPLPNTPVPVTLQTLFVILSGMALGSRLGAASQSLYLLLGVVGLPVFAKGGGGFAYLYGPTAGYLVGFVLASYFAGLITGKANGRFFVQALAAMVATGVIYLMGISWIGFQEGSLSRALEWGLYPFLIGGVLKCGLAAALGHLLGPAFKRIW